MDETIPLAPSQDGTRPLPPHSSPSLLSLPNEILMRIAAKAERADMLSMAFVCKRFAEVCRPEICRHLRLVEPYADLQSWRASRLPNIEVGSGLVVAVGKIEGAISMGSEERWAMVQEITLIPGSAQLERITSILSECAPTLRVLDIVLAELPAPTQGVNDWFDLQLHQSDIISFPSLVHVDFSINCILYVESIAMLCSLAPNLVFLRACVDTEEIPEKDSVDAAGRHVCSPSDTITGMTCVFPRRFSNDTKLRQLFIENRGAVERHFPVYSYSVILELLQYSPLVEQLALVFPPSRVDGLHDAHLLSTHSTIRGHSALRDLVWPARDLAEGDAGAEISFPSLRRLVLTYHNWKSGIFPHTIAPSLPSLITMCIDFDLAFFYGRAPTIPNSESVEAAIPSFAAWLRNYPLLRNIHFLSNNRSATKHTSLFPTLDRVEQTDSFTGKIQSLCHRGQEVIRVSLLFQKVLDAPLAGQPQSSHHYLHIAGDYLVPWDAVNNVGEPEWLSFVDFEGKAVPADVWEEMCRAEGAKAGGRGGRGEEVGTEAWEVLTNWREGLGA